MKNFNALMTTRVNSGIIENPNDLYTISVVLQRHESSDAPIYRTDLSGDWTAMKVNQGRSPAGVGIKTTTIMEFLAPLLGRVYVFDGFNKAGSQLGGRLCLPKDVPVGFDPVYGIRKAA